MKEATKQALLAAFCLEVDSRQRALIAAIDAALNRKRHQTSVFLLGRCPEPSGPTLLVRTFALAPGEQITGAFRPVVPIEAGAWVVCAGSATLCDVRINNHLQAVSRPSEGQVSLTIDALIPGGALEFELCQP